MFALPSFNDLLYFRSMSGKKMESSIAELLHEHDCVIVPDFGGFIANYKSAHIHPRLNVICPPSKSISFNKMLLRNDGVIANYIAEKEGISYTEALVYIDKTVRDYKSALDNGKRLEIEAVGALYFDSQKNLQFIPNQETNFLSSSFGLQNIPLPEIMEVETVETPVIPITQKQSTKSPWWVGAAAVALPLALVSIFLFQDVFSSGHQFDLAGLNPFSSFNASAEYQPLLEREAISMETEENSTQLETAIANSADVYVLNFDFEKDAVSDEGISVRLKEAKIPSTPELKASSLGLYFVIAGAFEMEDNAKGLVKDLQSKGYDAAEIGMRGRLHLVAYGAHNSRSSAKKALKDIQNKDLSGWIYKK